MFTWETKRSILKALVTRDSPFYIQFFVSSRCNLKCQMCNIVAVNKGEKEVSLTEIEAIARNLRKIGAGIVLLTGGEPFLRKDLPEIVRILKAEKLDVRLQTHGFMTNRGLIEECLKNGAVDINISFDSLDEQVQDKINRVPGSWAQMLETISYITRTFPERDKICAFGCVLSRYNYKEIPDLVRFATKIGWYVSLVPVHIIDTHQGYNFRGRDRSFAFREEDLDEVDRIIDRLIQMKKEGYALFDAVAYLESCKSFVRKGRPTWRNRKTGLCDSPNLYFAIRPNGDFAVCCDHNFPEKLSVFERDFPKIYCNNEFRSKVREITGACVGCQFGSYPEVTLSVRDRSAFLERVGDILHPKSMRKASYSPEDLLSIIEEIRTGKGKPRSIPIANS